MTVNSVVFAVILAIVLLMAFASIILACIHLTRYPNILSVREFLKVYIKSLWQ